MQIGFGVIEKLKRKRKLFLNRFHEIQKLEADKGEKRKFIAQRYFVLVDEVIFFDFSREQTKLRNLPLKYFLAKDDEWKNLFLRDNYGEEFKKTGT